jgi:poly-gamma-glutamate capsule biosynthesis protein CapA/YwtB (metallophosphatase superfamily)
MLHKACLVACLFLAAALACPGEPLPPPLSAVKQAGTPCLTLLLVGDVMLGRGVAQALEGDWEAAFAGVRPWLSGDALRSGCDNVVAFANLESPLTDAPQVRSGHDLRAPPAAVAALCAGGFDAVSLVNNHALDAGEMGLQETVRALRAAGIVPWLDGAAVEATAWMPMGASNGAPIYRGLAFDDSALPLDVEAAAAAVAAAAEQAGAIVVSIHWGGEYQAAPSARQRAVARVLAEAGADVIVGHGPHVLQRVEWVGETLVAYSLGNFLFDQPYPVDCRQGAVLSVTLRGGEILTVEALATVAERGRVRPAGPEAATAILSRLGMGSTAVRQDNVGMGQER